MQANQTLQSWVLEKLETIKESPNILVRDPLGTIPREDRQVGNFAITNGFMPLWATTNLAFRQLYELAKADPSYKKLLLIDQAPVFRNNVVGKKAPPPFYPDFLAQTPIQARLELDLRHFLREITGDSGWPHETNEPRYARLIMLHLDGVVLAYQNLRNIAPGRSAGRFTDQDFKRIVAFAALGVAESAFKKLDARDYWKIGLLGHESFEELEHLAPEVTATIKDELRQAPAPFCWLADHDHETVIRAFYLAVLLNQHLPNWKLVLVHLDSSLIKLTNIDPAVLQEASARLVELDPEQARRDLETLEQSLDQDALQSLLIEHLKLEEPEGFTAVLEKESYSTLLRGLALLLALEQLLVYPPKRDAQPRIYQAVSPDGNQLTTASNKSFVESRASQPWLDLVEVYRLAYRIQAIRVDLNGFIKQLKVSKPEQLTYKLFRDWWNGKQLNRLEYYLSAMERLVYNNNLLMRDENELPIIFQDAVSSLKTKVSEIKQEVNDLLGALNVRFQEMVVRQYPTWVAEDSEVRLTSQFLRRCLKPYWDIETEKAAVFVFDGMRYDIWDELLRPMLEDRLELLEDFPASALLPSETEVSRWAIAAGTEPQQFWPRKAENMHLKEGLTRECGYTGEVVPLVPEGAGTGETVRYRAGNLDYYIFEFCDKALHSMQVKKLDDGSEVPTRPLAYVYEQQIKNLIETEVMAIVRHLDPGTKVFITADHGFGPVARQKLWFDSNDLNDPADCVYLHALLKVPIEQALLPNHVRANIISFTPQQLRMYDHETITKKTGSYYPKYEAVVFPKVGYSFSRNGFPYRPDAYSHGGISIQELMIPMVVMKVKTREKGLLTLDPISGPNEALEGEELVFRLQLHRTTSRTSSRNQKDGEDLAVEVEATCTSLEVGEETEDAQPLNLPRQLLYLSRQEGERPAEVIYRFKPGREQATLSELQHERMKRLLTITISYREGRRTVRKSQSLRFTVQLKSERVIRRVPSSLGSIMGLTPRQK
ncbi:hypothetical protein [Candidatus Chlorohelix sp.]|uniref:hypothetical protein n=1 Tax=Candidatus Chlorohelix sp. TaxID=3139201 RepID=UPI003044D39C